MPPSRIQRGRLGFLSAPLRRQWEWRPNRSSLPASSQGTALLQFLAQARWWLNFLCTLIQLPIEPHPTPDVILDQDPHLLHVLLDLAQGLRAHLHHDLLELAQGSGGQNLFLVRRVSLTRHWS